MLVFLGLITVDPRQISADSPTIAGVAGPSVNMIYAYVPQDAGLWKKHGLDVRMVLFEAGSTLAQVARAGEVKFAVNSGPDNHRVTDPGGGFGDCRHVGQHPSLQSRYR